MPQIISKIEDELSGEYRVGHWGNLSSPLEYLGGNSPPLNSWGHKHPRLETSSPFSMVQAF